ncbi:hypothetical protein [Cribrihabitans pelagius]|uniref:hypothetical protein n=1 Tax=Cribrihabitans pelagius TaxID=1765746 RepID=UPI003B5B5248
MQVETARTQVGRVDLSGKIGGADQQEALLPVQQIDLAQELVDHLATIGVIAVAGAGAGCAH